MASNQHEVVIQPDGGMEKEHAELVRKQLLRDGFHDHAVTVRPVDEVNDGA